MLIQSTLFFNSFTTFKKLWFLGYTVVILVISNYVPVCETQQMSPSKLLNIHTPAFQSWSSFSISKGRVQLQPRHVMQDDVASSAASGHATFPAWCTAISLQFPKPSTSGWENKQQPDSSTALRLFTQQCGSETTPSSLATTLLPHFQNALLVCFNREQTICD